MNNKLIQQLQAIQGLQIECPNCAEPFSVRQGKLFSMYDSYPPAVQKILRARRDSAEETQQDIKARRKQLAADKKAKPAKITLSAKATNFGQIAEQILPAFKTFPYNRSECRILFKPIDYVVFTHLSADGKVESIKFVDVKTGDARLDLRQRQIRDRIQQGKIKHKLLK
jgi:predicted Holliday junction resolvase-like endonuclease